MLKTGIVNTILRRITMRNISIMIVGTFLLACFIIFMHNILTKTIHIIIDCDSPSICDTNFSKSLQNQLNTTKEMAEATTFEHRLIDNIYMSELKFQVYHIQALSTIWKLLLSFEKLINIRGNYTLITATMNDGVINYNIRLKKKNSSDTNYYETASMSDYKLNNLSNNLILHYSPVHLAFYLAKTLPESNPDEKLNKGFNVFNFALNKMDGKDAALVLTLMAYQYKEQNKYDEAIAKLNDALNYYPKSADALFCLGLCYLHKAVAKDSGVIPSKDATYLTQTFKQIPISNYTIPNDNFIISGIEEYDIASRYFVQSLDYHPDNLSAIFNHLFSLIRRGKIQECIDFYESVFTPSQYFMYPFLESSMASVFIQAGMYDDAIQRLERLESMSPNDASIKNRLSIAYATSGSLDKASGKAQEALAIDPNSAVYHTANAYILGKQGLYTAALNEYHTAAKLDTKSARPHFEMAKIFEFQLKAFDKAEEEYAEAITLSNHDPEYISYFINILYNRKKYEDVKIACDKYSQLFNSLNSAAHDINHNKSIYNGFQPIFYDSIINICYDSSKRFKRKQRSQSSHEQ